MADTLTKTVEVDNRGRALIPLKMRTALNIGPGTNLLIKANLETEEMIVKVVD